MSTNISVAEAQDYRRKALSMIARAKTALEKADVAVEKVVHATVTGGSAFMFGVIQGRYGQVEFVGVPADLGAAVLLHAAGFMGVGGKASEYLHAAGNGALACYLTTLGRGVGVDWKARALSGGGAAAPGLPAAASGSPLSDRELEQLARGNA